MDGWSDEVMRVMSAISGKRVVPPASELMISSVLYAQLSYSMAGEDSLMAKFFKKRLGKRQPGFYIDIGAGAVWDISNTFMFYSHGWRGICIDPNPASAVEWKRYRPRDVFVSAAVADEEGAGFWHQHTANWGASRVSRDGMTPGKEWKAGQPVPFRRLDAILAEHAGDREIQLMTIDVEGAELGVLASNDWNRWRPELIMLECVDFQFDAPYAEPTVKFLVDHGYQLTDKISANVVLRRA